MSKLYRLISIILLLCSIAGCGVQAEDSSSLIVYAMDSGYVRANGRQDNISTYPFVFKSTSYVPVRYTLMALGAESVDYIQQDNSILVSYNGQIYKKKLDSCLYKNDSSYLPAREVAQIVGAKVAWNSGILVLSTGSTDPEVQAKKFDHYATVLSYTGHVDWSEVPQNPVPSEQEKTQEIKRELFYSAEAGCYNDEFMLHLSTNVPSGQIRYTTDGSEPTLESPLYTQPIRIYDKTMEPHVAANIPWIVKDGFVPPRGFVRKGMTVKARVFDPSGPATPTCVRTYFVGVNFASKYRMKVINISAPHSSLFDPQTGIYTYANSVALSNKAECNGFIEIFDNNRLVIAQPIGIRLNGMGSRVLPQKALRIYARNNEEFENAKKSFKYDLFDGKVKNTDGIVVEKYKRFILRNGGDDWKNFFMKDAVYQAICAPLDVERQASEDTMVFINGEFFGYYRMRERYDDEYFKYHYQLENEKDVAVYQIQNSPWEVTLSEGLNEDLPVFNEKLNFVINNDMTKEENYRIAESYFNTGSLIDYYIANVFFENVDWPNNNVKMWHIKNPAAGDTRIRFMLTDGDTTFVDLGWIYEDAYGPESAIAKKFKGSKSKGTLGYKLDDVDCLIAKFVSSLMKNDNFRIEFVRRYNDYLNTFLTSWNVKRYAEKYFTSPLHVRDEQLARHPMSWSKSDLYDINTWADQRPAKARKELENYFGYKERVNVTFKTNPMHGYVRANSIVLKENTPFELDSPYNYTAKYYKDLPLWFGVVPQPGYAFDHFIVNGEKWTERSEYVINPTKETTIEAVFRRAG